MRYKKFLTACEATNQILPLGLEWTLFYGEPTGREGLVEFAVCLDLENPMTVPGCYYVASSDGSLGVTMDDGRVVQWIARIETPAPPEERMLIAETPEAVVSSEAKKKLKEVREMFTFKGALTKLLISGLSLLAIWLGTMIWQHSCLSNGKAVPFIAKALAFLTFANGGVSSNFFYMIGGTLGKMFVMTTLFAFVMGGFKKVARGAERFIHRTIHLESMRGISLYAAGAGVACILYNFFCGTAELSLCMVGVAGILSMLWSLGGGIGFVRNITISLTAHVNRQSKVHYVHLERASYALAGAAAGFLLAIILSVFPWNFTPYIVGASLLAVAGMLLPFVKTNDDLEPERALRED